METPHETLENNKLLIGRGWSRIAKATLTHLPYWLHWGFHVFLLQDFHQQFLPESSVTFALLLQVFTSFTTQGIGQKPDMNPWIPKPFESAGWIENCHPCFEEIRWNKLRYPPGNHHRDIYIYIYMYIYIYIDIPPWEKENNLQKGPGPGGYVSYVRDSESEVLNWCSPVEVNQQQ